MNSHLRAKALIFLYMRKMLPFALLSSKDDLGLLQFGLLCKPWAHALEIHFICRICIFEASTEKKQKLALNAFSALHSLNIQTVVFVEQQHLLLWKNRCVRYISSWEVSKEVKIRLQQLQKQQRNWGRCAHEQGIQKREKKRVNWLIWNDKGKF